MEKGKRKKEKGKRKKGRVRKRRVRKTTRGEREKRGACVPCPLLPLPSSKTDFFFHEIKRAVTLCFILPHYLDSIVFYTTLTRKK